MKLLAILKKEKFYFLLTAELLFIFLLPIMPAKSVDLAGIFIPLGLSIILISGINTIERGLLFKRIIFSIATIFVIINSVLYFEEHKTLHILSFAIFFGLFAFILKEIIFKLMRATIINPSLIVGTLAGYLLMAICAAFFLITLSAFNPNALSMPEDQLNFVNILYFTLTTITTIGYGDIAPIGPLAKIAATMTAVFAQFYLAVVVAIIVGKIMNKQHISKSE